MTGDNDTAMRIVAILKASGLGYENTKFDNWVDMDRNEEGLIRAIVNSDTAAAQNSIELLRKLGKKDSSIKSMLQNYFKPIYHNAYRSGYKGEAESIANALKSIGFGFEYFNFDDWLMGEEIQ